MKSQTETEEALGSFDQVHGKWYDDACSAALALEVMGERWAMLVIREMLLGPRRFSDLRAGLPAISAKVLTQRLESLQHHGVVRKRRLPPPAASQVYELTEWGYLAERPLLEMCRWGVMSRAHDPRLPLSPTALMLSMRAMLVPERALHLAVTARFEVNDESFVAAIGKGSMHIERGDAQDVDLVFTADVAHPLLAAFYGKVPLGDLRRAGVLSVEGDLALAERVVGLFELPPKVHGPPG